MRSCVKHGYLHRAEGARWPPLASTGHKEPADFSLGHGSLPGGWKGMHALGVPASDPQMKYGTEYGTGMYRCRI